MGGPLGRHELRAVLESLGVDRSQADRGMSQLLAIGWATVELDRAARELALRLPVRGTFRATPASATLGATCRIGALRAPGWPTVVLLEPSTEGRLAGALARAGERWVAAWWQSALPGFPAAIESAESGPLGPERLLAGASSGPFHLTVGPATIGG